MDEYKNEPCPECGSEDGWDGEFCEDCGYPIDHEDVDYWDA